MNAWMLVPGSVERFDGIRDFASHLAAALGGTFDLELFTTSEDRAPVSRAAVLSSWAALPRGPVPRAVFINYSPQAWLRRDTRALLSRLSAARAAGARIVLIVHEYQLDPAPSIARGGARFVFRRLARAFAARATAIVATHGFVAEWARGDGLERFCPVITIPAGSNLPEPADSISGRQAARAVMFGQPAGMSPEPTASGASELAEGGAELVWICRREDEARSWMDRHGVDPATVRIAAGLDNAAVSRELAQASIGFAPIVDGVSTRRTTVAAMLQHRLPIAGSDGRATDPVLRDSGAFTLSRTGDGDGAARALRELLRDPLKRERMAGAARALFESHLAWPRIAGEYARLVS